MVGSRMFTICATSSASVATKDYISGCGAFSFNSQSVSLLQAYLLLELFSSSLLAETSGKCPLVFSVTSVIAPRFYLCLIIKYEIKKALSKLLML